MSYSYLCVLNVVSCHCLSLLAGLFCVLFMSLSWENCPLWDKSSGTELKLKYKMLSTNSRNRASRDASSGNYSEATKRDHALWLWIINRLFLRFLTLWTLNHFDSICIELNHFDSIQNRAESLWFYPYRALLWGAVHIQCRFCDLVVKAASAQGLFKIKGRV